MLYSSYSHKSLKQGREGTREVMQDSACLKAGSTSTSTSEKSAFKYYDISVTGDQQGRPSTLQLTCLTVRKGGCLAELLLLMPILNFP